MEASLHNGDDVPVLILAHGAGAPMDSPFMAAMAELIGAGGIDVQRFEFAYMAARRTTGKKAPPPRAERLMDEFQAVIDAQNSDCIFIGGKSMGGRVASMIAERNFEAGRIRGLVCLGYPFHPPGKPEKLRTSHLMTLKAPALIAQGENDPFGGRGEVEDYGLPGNFTVSWAAAGNHDLTPPKRTGVTQDQAWKIASDVIIKFIHQNK